MAQCWFSWERAANSQPVNWNCTSMRWKRPWTHCTWFIIFKKSKKVAFDGKYKRWLQTASVAPYHMMWCLLLTRNSHEFGLCNESFLTTSSPNSEHFVLRRLDLSCIRSSITSISLLDKSRETAKLSSAMYWVPLSNCKQTKREHYMYILYIKCYTFPRNLIVVIIRTHLLIAPNSVSC